MHRPESLRLDPYSCQIFLQLLVLCRLCCEIVTICASAVEEVFRVQVTGLETELSMLML